MTLPKKNWLEWLVFAVGLVLSVGVVAFLTYEATTAGDTPPSMVVQLGAPERQAQHFAVPVAVTNEGDQTAEGVLIEVVLENGGVQQERAEFEIAFLPRGATRQAWAVFEADPSAGGQLKARVISYQEP